MASCSRNQPVPSFVANGRFSPRVQPRPSSGGTVARRAAALPTLFDALCTMCGPMLQPVLDALDGMFLMSKTPQGLLASRFRLTAVGVTPHEDKYPPTMAQLSAWKWWAHSRRCLKQPKLYCKKQLAHHEQSNQQRELFGKDAVKSPVAKPLPMAAPLVNQQQWKQQPNQQRELFPAVASTPQQATVNSPTQPTAASPIGSPAPRRPVPPFYGHVEVQACSH